MRDKNRIRNTVLMVASIMLTAAAVAQSGSFSMTVTGANSRFKPISINFTKPLFKSDDSHGFWVINPHTGSRHVTLMPPPGYGNADAIFIDVNEKDNDFDLYTATSNDSDNVSFKNNAFAITAPRWNVQDKDNNKPLHFHFSTFTASEVAFTVSGYAEVFSSSGNGEDLGTGIIKGSGHFYRDPKYLTTDKLPGCDCDPTIYPVVYDQENFIRSISACEAALNNKLFDAVQQSMAGLFTGVASNSGGNTKAGETIIRMIAGHVDISGAAKERSYCTPDYYHSGLTRFDGQKRIFSSDDRFGVQLIKMPSDEAMGLSEEANAKRTKQTASLDSIGKLFAAKKITMEQYSKAMTDALTNASQGSPDIKKLEAENNLYITVIINPDNATETELKLADKNKTVVTHQVKGAAFEIFSPIIKDSDGDWIKSRCGIYIGKFSAPVMGKSGGGFDAETTKVTYPANANKLGVYNIIVKMEGGKELIDKAIAHIDFNALQSLISK